MCSVLGILDLRSAPAALRPRALEMSRRMRHRGPDWSGVYVGPRALLCHERLAIVGIESGAQPLYSTDRQRILAVNGEIYNHRELEQEFEGKVEFTTGSDCEVLLALYAEEGPGFVDRLNGIFAFILYDEENDEWLIARDHLGICPLYTGYDADGNFYVASEMKALTHVCTHVQEFPPGHFLWSRTGELTRYYERPWRNYETVAESAADPEAIRQALEDAVRRQLMSDVPYGVLLSGGLDSSVIAAVASRFYQRRIEDDGRSPAWWPQLHSFSVGLEGAPDLTAARRVSDMLGTVHHEMHFTVEEGLDALRDVIHHLETYDVTTIRASTPMYLMARKIRAMGVKMVLSGEGADEIFGGYLYFHKAPDARAFHEETIRKLDRLHSYDCLRANKSMMAWGVEARVPFLDREFLEVAMSIAPEAKRAGPDAVEKRILREAFEGWLPDEILWRQKEQFSDGVGYSWIDSLKAHAEVRISDAQLERARFRFPHNPPDSKEAYLYREIFQDHFPLEAAARCVPGGPSVACSTPEALLWDASLTGLNDPSGRSVKGVHRNAY